MPTDQQGNIVLLFVIGTAAFLSLAATVIALVLLQQKKNLAFRLERTHAEAEKQQEMHALLEEKNQELEVKVEERTYLLSEANVALEKTIAELKATQEQLIVSEKIASVGKLIANLSHELNNPLGAIRASANVMQKQLGEVVNSLPETLRQFNDDELALVRLLVNQGVGTEAPSFRSLRKMRKEFQETLVNAGVTKADEIAEMLVMSGVTELDKILYLLTSPGAHAVVSTAARLVQVMVSIQTLNDASERTRRILSLLRTFDEGALKRGNDFVELQPSVQQILQAVASRMGSRVTVTTYWGQQVWIKADPEHLALIWNALLMNAIQAIKGEVGEIAVSTDFVEGTASVCVHDTGEGIPEAMRGKIFQPFFTTKTGGEGSGLGLYLCHKLTDLYEGDISFKSRPGRTEFTITLPATNALLV